MLARSIAREGAAISFDDTINEAFYVLAKWSFKSRVGAWSWWLFSCDTRFAKVMFEH
jgi:hypothetical protein